MLLGVKLNPVLDSPNETKMKAFWMNQDEVPTGVLWVNGPRMDIDSLHWAPESLLDDRTWALSFPDGGPWASRSSEGLVFQGIEGFSLVNVPLPAMINNVLEFHDTRFEVSCYIARMENVGNPRWTKLADYWANCALLRREPLAPDVITAGVLLSCGDVDKKTETGRKHARWLAQVSVSVRWENGTRFFLKGSLISWTGRLRLKHYPSPPCLRCTIFDLILSGVSGDLVGITEATTHLFHPW